MIRQRISNLVLHTVLAIVGLGVLGCIASAIVGLAQAAQRGHEVFAACVAVTLGAAIWSAVPRRA